MDHNPSTDANKPKGETRPVGWLTGTAAGFMLMVIGVLVSFTGIGLIIGLPLILAGIAYPFIARHIIRGPCPYCGMMFSTLDSKPRIKCRACGKHIVIRDKKFFRTEEP